MNMELRLEQTVRQRKPQPGRYGMKYATIKNCQEHGRYLNILDGWPGVRGGILSARAYMLTSAQHSDGRVLAHWVIQMAAVIRPEDLKFVITGGK